MFLIKTRSGFLNENYKGYFEPLVLWTHSPLVRSNYYSAKRGRQRNNEISYLGGRGRVFFYGMEEEERIMRISRTLVAVAMILILTHNYSYTVCEAIQ